MRLIILAFAACAAGCGSTPAPDHRAARSPPARVEAPAAVVSLNEKTPLLDWHVGWPAEVSAIPALARSIRDPAIANRAELLTSAKDDKAFRDGQHFDFHAYQSSLQYAVAGQTPRLLSLAGEWFEFTGGAHPNHGTRAILWDKSAGRAITVADLVDGPAALDRLLNDPFCAALDKERAKRRGPDRTTDPDDPFNACPKLSEVVIIPSGANVALLSTLRVHADPYVAGPYVEGDYDIALPVTAAFIAALAPDYRASFAPGQRQ